MQRRTINKLALGLVTGAAAGGGVFYLNGHPAPETLNFESIESKLQAIKTASPTSSGAWQPGRIFAHCAQSIELSMQGFPSHKAEWFKNSIGAAAFAVFAHLGKMTHGLSEPIPGAPALAQDYDIMAGIERLQAAVAAFRRWEQDFEPHFAYGALSRREVELAHVLHINNHLSEITW